ncbi:MAG: four helix bundle protein [Acidobacteria bacterium]|nr:four helix bundle protein [Acidobacteriota bacterium]MBI3422294.1 four helix bundle protein [Acidobacteriota bacterium]
MYSQLPKTAEAQIIGKQVLRSGTSIGAYYRESCRAKSDAESLQQRPGQSANFAKARFSQSGSASKSCSCLSFDYV